METTTYTLHSVKQAETFKGTREQAITRAIAIEDEHQPAFGVSVIDDATGEHVAEIRDGVNIDATEAL